MPYAILRFELDRHDIEYVHIYRKWNAVGGLQFVSPIFIDEFTKLFPEPIVDEILNDPNDPYCWVRADTMEVLDEKEVNKSIR